MPRTTAPDTRGGGAASSGLGRKRSLVARGTSAKNEVVRQTRAALGEITNAAAKGHKDGCVGPMGKKGNSNSLKSQVKKGLTSIVVTASRRRSSQTATQAKQQKLVTSTSSSRQARGGSPPLHLQSSFDSNGSNSLPSSQEEESVQRLREKLAAEQLDLSKLSDESDESYHSASEGNDHEAKNHRYNPPARVVPPTGVKDFDLENLDDPATCSEYAADIFQYYKDREVSYKLPKSLYSRKALSYRVSFLTLHSTIFCNRITSREKNSSYLSLFGSII